MNRFTIPIANKIRIRDRNDGLMHYPRRLSKVFDGDPIMPFEGYARIVQRLEDGLLISLDVSIPNTECVKLETILETIPLIKGRSTALTFAGPKTRVTFENETEKIGRFQCFRKDNGNYFIKWC